MKIDTPKLTVDEEGKHITIKKGAFILVLENGSLTLVSRDREKSLLIMPAAGRCLTVKLGRKKRSKKE